MANNGSKALIRAIAIAVATFVEHPLSEPIEHIRDWAKARRSRRQGSGPKM